MIHRSRVCDHLIVLLDPAFGTGLTGAADRYVAMTRATQQLVVRT